MRAEELTREAPEQTQPEQVFQAGVAHYELEDLLDVRLPLGHKFGGLHTPVDEVL